MTKTSKKILDKIEKEHIKPRPKWQFVAMHILMFVLFGLTIFLGALAVSVILVKVMASDWSVIPRLPGGPLLVLPYLWILLFGIMILVASFLFEQTEKGYKHNLWIVAIASIGLSIILGSLLFAVRVGEGVEDGLREHFKPYKQYVEMREKAWHAPEHGVLPGRVIEIEKDIMILLDDLKGLKWDVDITDAKMPMRPIKIDQIIIVVGKKTGEGEFDADGVRPGNVLKEKLKNKKAPL